MTPEERARDAGVLCPACVNGVCADECVDAIAAAIRAAVLEEREACAREADGVTGSTDAGWQIAAETCAERIRGRPLP